MNQRKSLTLWQFILLLVFLVAMLVTMFLPFIRINGNNMNKAARIINSATGDVLDVVEDLVGTSLPIRTQEMTPEEIQEFDQGLMETEMENGVKFSSVAPISIMTKSALSFFLGNHANDPDTQDALKNIGGMGMDMVSKPYNSLKALFWTAYALALVLMILVILNFALKFTKIPTAIVSMVYGATFAGIFIYIRCFSVTNSIKQALKSGTDMLGDGLLGSIAGAAVSAIIGPAAKLFGQVAGCFFGIGPIFMIIIAVAILIVGLLTLLIGGGAAAPIPVEPPYTFEPEPIGGEPILPQPTPMPVEPPVFDPYAGTPAPAPAPAPAPVVMPQAQAEPMGKVVCTAGVAMGQGFSLPASRKVIVGKSATRANLRVDYETVSNVHCSIRYEPMNNTYVVKDHSTNGTFVNGVRLAKDVAMSYPAGTVLTLADGKNQITLG